MSPYSETDRLDAKIPGAFPEGNASQTSFSTHQTLSEAVRARSAEYTRPRQVRIKVGTWNVGAQKGTEKDVGAWFVEGKGIEESFEFPTSPMLTETTGFVFVRGFLMALDKL